MHPILADRQRLQLHLLAWALVGVMLGLLVWTLVGTPWIQAMVFGLPLGIVAAPISLSSWYLCRAMPLSRTASWRVGGTAIGASLVTAGMWSGLGRLWWMVLDWSGLELGEPPNGLFTLVVGLGVLAYLIVVTVHYVLQAFEESAAASRRALESQVAQRDAELRALRAQIDPHFLFNSLNSIAGLIGPDPAKARVMAQMLGEFLRDSLRVGAASRIPLDREVALAEQYLKVEQVRFGSRLTLRAEVAADSGSVPVPPLILQPLVENAVRHGVATRLDGGTIEILAHRAGDRAVVTVSNPRDADATRKGMGIGQDIVRRRLAAVFGDRASVSIEALPESYRVSLTIPIEDPA